MGRFSHGQEWIQEGIHSGYAKRSGLEEAQDKAYYRDCTYKGRILDLYRRSKILKQKRFITAELQREVDTTRIDLVNTGRLEVWSQ